jgi:hypothetical protein
LPSGDAGEHEGMKLVDWWRQRRREQKQEAKTIEEMRRVDESDNPMPQEAYFSQTRD